MSSCDRDYGSTKLKIFTLWPCRKRFPTPGLGQLRPILEMGLRVSLKVYGCYTVKEERLQKYVCVWETITLRALTKLNSFSHFAQCFELNSAQKLPVELLLSLLLTSPVSSGNADTEYSISCLGCKGKFLQLASSNLPRKLWDVALIYNHQVIHKPQKYCRNSKKGERHHVYFLEKSQSENSVIIFSKLSLFFFSLKFYNYESSFKAYSPLCIVL